MWETIFAFAAACFVIFVAGLLVHRQRRREEELRRLEETLLETFDDIVDEVELFTYEDLPERTLTYLEKRMNAFDKSLPPTTPPKTKYKKGGRKHAKFKAKKHFTND